ncbi:flagellar basal body protein FliL [Leminorella grimontii]|uniref:Flagellar protein FliL n=1 Tax=Leminorella grimontii TaxID=82981 RepID=A0AAV5N2F8_9GAMM|nr:flagellar basal body-associated FliL family protein [Leminorella grimontii]KFC93574.1 hypothetical protein GLGR_3137 [Leminorella grimontii ATCC 33999 = DSM 5078]GKX55730.1 flagellar basal body protein FliL [Leminorella grimontii]GKX59539.1 flagellar basal body protein FliL [Leminorella grimontii]VFS55270.1 flagellar basal body-associated protein FliL [Leminorella grimontii]
MKKILLIGLFSALLAAVVGGGAAFGVMHYMQKSMPVSGAKAEPEKAKSKGEERTNMFVSLPEAIITLQDSANDDRYIVLELVMVTDAKPGADRIKADEPLYQSIVVNTLMDMSYEQVRSLKISEIRTLLMSALDKELKAREITVPYSDVLVKKVVFQ